MNLQYAEPSSVLTDAPPLPDQPHWSDENFGPLTDSGKWVVWELAPWRDEMRQRFKHIGKLRRGWDGFNSPPPSATTIAFAQSILNEVMSASTPPPSLVPISGGGLQLEWHTGGYDIELAVFAPNEAELCVEFPDGREPIDDLELEGQFTELNEVLDAIS